MDNKKTKMRTLLRDLQKVKTKRGSIWKPMLGDNLKKIYILKSYLLLFQFSTNLKLPIIMNPFFVELGNKF